MHRDTQILLSGPRGRRLCLEVAKRASPGFAELAFWLGHNRDPDVIASDAVVRDASSLPRPEPSPAAASISMAVEALSSLDLSALADEWVQAGLVEAVASARYWQEPDGDDVLTAEPTLRAALEPVAHAVLNSAPAQTWNQPCQARQWKLDWPTSQTTAAVCRESARVLADWSHEARAAELRALSAQRSDPSRSTSGAWWSIPLRITHTVGHIPAALDLIEDGFGECAATVIPVQGAGKIYEIRTPEDWTHLCRRFPLEVSASRHHDWSRTTGRTGRWVIPDWEQVASEWDAVHLTTLGYLSTATQSLPVSSRAATVLAGWNPDTTLWLTDTVHESAEPRQHWRRQDPFSAWVPC